jgi:flagellar basal body-associated protein FliL
MAEDNSNPAPAAEKPAGGKNKMLMIAFISAVVLVETGMFFFLVPSAEDVSALAEAKLIKSIQEGEEKADQEAVDENLPKEFAMGVFGETFKPIDSDRSFRVELRLFGLVQAKNEEKLTTEFEKKQGRLQHAIRMKIRNSELSELQDNQLGLLERRILTTCNHLLGEDLLLGIGFNQYQLIED